MKKLINFLITFVLFVPNVDASNEKYFLNCESIESKNFKCDLFEFEIVLIRMQSPPYDYKIWMEWEVPTVDLVGGCGIVKSLNHVYIDIKDDLDMQSEQFATDIIYFEDIENSIHSHSFSNPAIVDYVSSLIKSYPSCAIENNISQLLCPVTTGGWLDVKDQTKTNSSHYGKSNLNSCIGMWEIKDDNYIFKIYAIDTDNNYENFEELYIEGNNLPLHKVKEIVGGLARFKTLDNVIKDIDLYLLTLKGDDNITILNKKVWEMILALSQHSGNNNSIEAFDSQYEYDFFETGKIYCSGEIKSQ